MIKFLDPKFWICPSKQGPGPWPVGFGFLSGWVCLLLPGGSGQRARSSGGSSRPHNLGRRGGAAQRRRAVPGRSSRRGVVSRVAGAGRSRRSFCYLLTWRWKKKMLTQKDSRTDWNWRLLACFRFILYRDCNYIRAGSCYLTLLVYYKPPFLNTCQF